MSELLKTGEPALVSTSENAIEFIDLLIVWAKWKKFIIGVTVLSALCAVAVSLLMPNIYQSTIRILPPQQNQSNAAALLSQFSGIAGGLGAGISKNQNDMYVAMIKSRTVADALVDRFSLLSVYKATYRVNARRRLEGNTHVLNGKDGIISIDVSDVDPKRATMIANAYGEELLKMTRNIAISQASQARLFFEAQLKLTKEKLNEGEEKLKGQLRSNGVISVDNESKALIETTARLRAQVTGKEIQVSALKAFVTENNTEYKRNVQELLSTKEELRKLENGQNTAKAAVSASEANGGLESMQLLRDVKYHQMLYEILSKQYEAARLDEAREVSIIQVMDKAIEPEVKIGPRRPVIVLMSMISAFLLSLLITLVLEYVGEIKGQPQKQEKIKLLWRYIVGPKRV
jgi:tyrosine-protein kinase Etk/Wzc